MTKPKLFPSLCKHTSMVLVERPEGFWTERAQIQKNVVSMESILILL